jgi:hypothetical protein
MSKDLCQADRSVKSEQTCDCHLHERQVCDVCQGVVCQADDTAVGEPVSASPLQSGCSGEAGVWFLHEFLDDEAVLVNPDDLTDGGELKSYRDVLLVNLNRVHAKQDGVFVRMEKIDGEVHYRQCPPPASSQSPIEERSDTDGAEQPGSSLTQKFKSKAQEIADRSMNQPVELVTAISSALSTAYEEGKASISHQIEAAVRAERERSVVGDAKARAQEIIAPYDSCLLIGNDRADLTAAIAAAIEAAVKAEREACAELAHTNWNSMKMLGSAYVDGACDAGKRIAAAIRSRGKDNG